MSAETKSPVDLWLEALESGEYTQGKGALCADGKFCCLGVACDLYTKHVGGMERYDKKGYVFFVWTSEDGFRHREDTLLPDPVRQWLGLRDKIGMLGESHPQAVRSLTGLNDTGSTFTEIAEIIKSRPAGLFVEEVSS